VNISKNPGRATLIIYCSLIVIGTIGTLFIYYVWSATLLYRRVENRWGEILEAHNKVIPPAKAEEAIKGLNPKGYRGYGAFEDAVVCEYDLFELTIFRNAIRIRKEFLRRFIDETNKKINFIDQNIDQLSIWDRWYYQKYKNKILKGDNGIISQSLLDMVLLLNFDKRVLAENGLTIYKFYFDLT